jgi:putative transposase
MDTNGDGSVTMEQGAFHVGRRGQPCRPPAARIGSSDTNFEVVVPYPSRPQARDERVASSSWVCCGKPILERRLLHRDLCFCRYYGPEFMSRAILRWITTAGIDTAFIDPGKPWQNGTDENFNGKFRDECLNMEWFRTRAEATVLIEQWRRHYNEVRPHSSLGYLTPQEFKSQIKSGHLEERASTPGVVLQ